MTLYGKKENHEQPASNEICEYQLNTPEMQWGFWSLKQLAVGLPNKSISWDWRPVRDFYGFTHDSWIGLTFIRNKKPWKKHGKTYENPENQFISWGYKPFLLQWFRKNDGFRSFGPSKILVFPLQIGGRVCDSHTSRTSSRMKKSLINVEETTYTDKQPSFQASCINGGGGWCIAIAHYLQ